MIKVLHHNDMDGIAAAAVINHINGNDSMEIDYLECDYSKNPVTSDLGDEDIDTIYILDLSFTKNTIHTLYEIMDTYKCPVVWIDHHASSVELLKELKENNDEVFNKYNDLLEHFIMSDFSGAYLTWLFFIKKGVIKNKHVPYAIQLVDDYDRWQFKMGDTTKFFELGFYSNPSLRDPTFVVWEDLLRSNSLAPRELIARGAHVYDYLMCHYNSYRKANAYESTICGIKCICINYKVNSWVFGDLYNKYPICVAWVFDGKRYNYSLYSNPKFKDTVNCAKIAESYGGGGHVGAAGFSSEDRVV